MYKIDRRGKRGGGAGGGSKNCSLGQTQVLGHLGFPKYDIMNRLLMLSNNVDKFSLFSLN